ncbi:hypothetical protein GCM10027440_33190 [Nocardiopsis coralliicola]
MDRMLSRLRKREVRRRPRDTELFDRAQDLADRYLDGLPRPESVRWVDNQTTRWGSCTPDTGAIRLSRRLSGMPSWVVDYVLVHELVHLLVPHHGPEFWELVHRFPKAERARGFLEGHTAAQRGGPDGSDDGDGSDTVDTPGDPAGPDASDGPAGECT